MNEQMGQTPPVTPEPAPAPTPTPTSAPQPVAPQGKNGGNKALKIILIVLLSCAVIAVLFFGVLGFMAKKAIDKAGPEFGENFLEKAMESSSGENVDLEMNGNEFEIKTEDGSFSTSNELPSNFPSDVPVYKGATVEAVLTSQGENGSGTSYNVTLTTSDSLMSVKEFYDSELPSNGWKVTQTYQSGGYSIGAEKGTRQLLVIMQESEGVTNINISVAEDTGN